LSIVCQGDPSPVDDNIYLPQAMRKVDMYASFSEELSGVDSMTVPSEDCFNKCWAAFFSHVKLPRNTKLGKCSTCTKIDQARKKCTAETRLALVKEKIAHISDTTLDRSMLSDRRGEASAYPREVVVVEVVVVLSIIIDWADPLKIPHQKNFVKTWLTKCKRPKKIFYQEVLYQLN